MITDTDPLLTAPDELHRKSLDQVAHLLSSYEAGRIGPEAFRVGVETIWAVAGGICRLPEFNELMREANAEVAALPSPRSTTVLDNGSSVLVVMRTCERVRILLAKGASERIEEFATEDEAIDHVKALASRVTSKGLKEMPV